jgi:putative lipoprotein
MLKLFVTILLALTLAGPAAAAKRSLPGEVTYRERMALPEAATLKIELIDLAIPDLPRLSVSAPTGPGQVPLAFTLTFEDSLILPNHAYALNAEITAGELTFRNAEPYPVSPLGQVEPVVIVTSLVAQASASSSEPPAAEPALPLLNITWSAVAIGETPIPPGVEVSLLVDDELRAGGVGGCNSYFAQAQIDENSFMVADVSKTMKSCLYERNMLEKSYYDALKAARSWVIDNGALLLLDGAGETLVKFTR